MKVFVVGLPQSGLRRVGAVITMMGLHLKHVVSDENYENADVFMNTPVWADYADLDRIYPGSKFVLSRCDVDDWYRRFMQAALAFYNHVVLKGENWSPWSEMDRRAYRTVFEGQKLTREFLLRRYDEHSERLRIYFKDREKDFLEIDVDKPEALQQMIEFLDKPLMQFPTWG